MCRERSRGFLGGSHHGGDSVYERERIHKVELVHAEHQLVGKDNAGAREDVHKDVEHCLELAA